MDEDVTEQSILFFELFLQALLKNLEGTSIAYLRKSVVQILLETNQIEKVAHN